MSDFQIGGQKVGLGERSRVVLDAARLYDSSSTAMPVEVIRGKEAGPVLFVSAAVHGDEINGVEVLRRLLEHRRLADIRGTLLVVPIVNVFGFNTKSRYLPDRRDLNRCFPGSERGSLASQVAWLFMREIVSKATHGIDLHTGAIHRSNVPQIRGCLDDAETRALAEGFGAPVTMHSRLRDGSLREAARARGIPMLLFEGGEALRFSDVVTRVGLRGVLGVMETIGMLTPRPDSRPRKSFVSRSSHWIRAPRSGILRSYTALGRQVKKSQVLATVSDAFGGDVVELRARHQGIVIGASMIPLVNRGDAVFHIALFDQIEGVEEGITESTAAHFG